MEPSTTTTALGPPHSTLRRRPAAVRGAMASSSLRRLSFTVLLLGLAAPLTARLFLATLAPLSSVLRGFLLRRYVFAAVNFMVLVVVKLTTSKQSIQEMPEAASPVEDRRNAWLDAALPSPSSTAPFRLVKQKTSREPSPESSPETTALGSAPENRGSGNEAPPASSPEDGATVGGENGKARATAAAPQLRKSKTWVDAPPRFQVEVTAGRELRRSETVLHEKAAYAAVRRAVADRRPMKAREEDDEEEEEEEEHDEMNRRFDAFIKKFNEQLRLQRLASLRRRRYIDGVYAAGE